MAELLPELIPWGCLLLIFLGMLIMQWRVVGALKQAIALIPSPAPTSPPSPLPAEPVVPDAAPGAPRPVPPELPPVAPPPAPLPAPPAPAPEPVPWPPKPPAPAPAPLPAPTVPPVALPPAPAPKPPAPKPPAPATGPFAAAPSWFQWSLREIGFHETGANLGIERYIGLAHTGSLGDPWCAIFVNAALESCSIAGSRSPSSQSFRNNPNFIQLNGAVIGAIAVFWRGTKTSGLGHVGFYRGEDADHVWVLGGNENDMVQIESLAKNSSTFGLIGYWWPKAVPLPVIKPIYMPAGSSAHVTVAPTTKQPSGSTVGKQLDITATMFGGQKSAYGGAIIDDQPGVALPLHFKGVRPRVRVTSKRNGVSIDCDIVDVGPWNTNDPYWETGTRPQAETGIDNTGRKTNKAGIDLTLAAAQATQIDGKGLVDWEFITSPSVKVT